MINKYKWLKKVYKNENIPVRKVRYNSRINYACDV